MLCHTRGGGGRKNDTECHTGGGGGSNKCGKSVTYYLNGPKHSKILHKIKHWKAFYSNYKKSRGPLVNEFDLSAEYLIRIQ